MKRCAPPPSEIDTEPWRLTCTCGPVSLVLVLVLPGAAVGPSCRRLSTVTPAVRVLWSRSSHIEDEDEDVAAAAYWL